MKTRQMSCWYFRLCAVCVNEPSEQEDTHLFQLVKTFQMHCRLKTCRKYKNLMGRFKFEFFSTEKNHCCWAIAKHIKSIWNVWNAK